MKLFRRSEQLLGFLLSSLSNMADVVASAQGGYKRGS